MNNNSMNKLIIFYDASCPLCVAEMRQLKLYDVDNRIVLANLHDEDFSQRYPHIDPVHAYRILHGQLGDGTLLKGLDVTCRAWSLVGRHKWLNVLRWPVIRFFADAIYLFFARYRNRISRLLMGKASCSVCSVDQRNKAFHRK